MPEYIVTALIEELKNRSIFNGIDEDTMKEIREALIKIVRDIVD